MPSDLTLAAIEPIELRVGPFLGTKIYQTFRRHIVNRGLDILTRDLQKTSHQCTNEHLNQLQAL